MSVIVNPSLLTSKIKEIFLSPSLLAQYKEQADTYTIGWSGPLTPVSRIAFVEEFGLQAVIEAEQCARDAIQADSSAFQQTNYARYLREAEEYVGCEHTIVEGGCIFAWSDNMSTPDGLTGYISDLVRFGDSSVRRCLVRVCRKFVVSEKDFFDPALPQRLISEFGTYGGSRSDDVPDSVSFGELTEAQRATFFTLGVLIVNSLNPRQWYFYDDEGYDYDRYKFLPADWKEVFSDTVSLYQAAEDERQCREAEEENRRREASHAHYIERCSRYEHFMKPLPDAGRLSGSAFRSLVTTTTNRNIASMLRHLFPGTSFRVRGNSQRYIEWTDGPTVDQVRNVEDLKLFDSSYRDNDGFCFNDFSKRFGCYEYYLQPTRLVSDAFVRYARSVIEPAVLALPSTTDASVVKDTLISIIKSLSIPLESLNTCDIESMSGRMISNLKDDSELCISVLTDNLICRCSPPASLPQADAPISPASSSISADSAPASASQADIASDSLNPAPTPASQAGVPMSSLVSAPSIPVIPSSSITLSSYSDTSFLLSGNSESFYRELRAFLKCGIWFSSVKAWCFPESRRQDVIGFLSSRSIPFTLVS